MKAIEVSMFLCLEKLLKESNRRAAGAAGAGWEVLRGLVNMQNKRTN